MRMRTKKIVDWVSYILFRLAEGATTIVSMKFCFWIGGISGSLLYYLLKKYRLLAIRNIHFAYGDSLSESEIIKLVKLHFSTLGSNFLCSVKLSTLESEELENYIEFEGLKYLQENIIEKKPIIYLVPHMGAGNYWHKLDRLLPQ